MIFGKKQSREEELLEREFEYGMIDRAFTTDATLKQMQREFGSEICIIKDERLDNIFFHFAFRPKKDKDGKIQKDENNDPIIDAVENAFMVGMNILLNNTVSRTSWLDRPHAEYLIALARQMIFEEKLRIKLRKDIDEITKSRLLNMLECLEGHAIQELGSCINGRRVAAIRVQPHLIRAEVQQRKEKKGESRWF